MAAPGAALRLRRLRQRFGISAPKVAVRTQVAWHWRALAAVVVLSISLASAAWIYDAGRRIAGFDSQSSAQALAELQARVAELEAELLAVRGVASTADSNLKIERVAQQQLAQQVKVLEAENAAMKQDLAFFEGLVPGAGGSEPGLRINRFRIEPDVQTGAYRYRMLLVHNATRQQKEFRGELRFFVTVRQGGKDAMISLPPEGDASARRYQLEVRNFHRAEGILPVPPGAVLKSVEVHVLQDGVVRTRQTINL